jgi:drug/metabolite transporter (DMT)-like permease
MPTHALALVAVAAVLHAGWNTLTKRAGDGFSFLWSSMALASLLMLPVAFFFEPASVLTWQALPYVAASALIHAAYFAALTSAYRVGDFGLVYPVARGLGVALSPPLAALLFGERMSWLGASGVALVVVGIVASGLSSRAKGLVAALAKGGGYAVLTGLLIAAYTLVDAAAARRVHPLPYVVASTLGAVVVLLPVALRRPALAAEWRANGKTIVLASTMNLSGYVLVLLAYRLAKTGYVVATREVSIVLSAFVGSVILREGNARARMGAAAVILAGVTLVALAR